MTPGRSLCDGSRESQPLSASKSKVNMTATRAPLGQGEVMREPPGLEAKWAHRTRSGGVSLRQCRRRPPGAGGTIAVGRSVARGVQRVAIDLDGDPPAVRRRLDADDRALAAHPVGALGIELLQDEIELDRLHRLERLVGLHQDARLAEVGRPSDPPGQEDQQIDVITSEPPALGTAGARPTPGGAERTQGPPPAGEGGPTPHPPRGGTKTTT